jgi:hypothetical protein
MNNNLTNTETFDVKAIEAALLEAIFEFGLLKFKHAVLAHSDCELMLAA